MNNNEVHR